MAGKQLKTLFRAFHTRDELSFRRAAVEIIEEEKSKHHHALARDLQTLLVAGGRPLDISSTVILPEPPMDREGDWPLADLRHPQRHIEDLVLAPRLADSLYRAVAEVKQWPALTNAGIPKSQRFLFTGPPGCGKTTAAEAIAAELGWPFLLVRLDAVVSSYLGETASNLRRIFEYADKAPLVVLFDEFDALGRSRSDVSEHGEMKRVVTSFLQMTDRYDGPSLILAASNHAGLLDSALWRRFDDVLSFSLPTVHEIRRLLRLRLRPVRRNNISIEALASSLRGLPHAAVEKFVWDARRNALLSGREELSEADIHLSLQSVKNRPW